MFDEVESPIGQVRAVLTNNPQGNDQQPSKEIGKGVKPPPFYVLVIIGDKLVHNCMVDSGSSSFVMPKQIADKLGLKYHPLEKGVIQLDGTSVNTLGIIKDLSLTLHACPNFLVPQDICAIDLPPFFFLMLIKRLYNQDR